MNTASSAPSLRDIEKPRVLTSQGWIEGFQRGRVASYLGVPYGEPPIGDLRFRAPRPRRPWDGVRSAVELGPQCLQSNPDFPAWLDPSPQSEDCLVLNVWTASGPGAAAPVMVWIHGGACAYGSAGAPVYNAARLAERGDVVVVSINHRLNAFGYAWFGDLLPELAEHANPGQRDIELALRWVRDNAAVFGGNPANITVFGQSGGGVKIGALCAAPSSAGLFDKMAILSGARTRFQDRAAATEVAQLLLSELGIAAPTVAALAEVSAELLKAAAHRIEAREGLLAFHAVEDGQYITSQPWSGTALATSAHIPLLIGTTSDESAGLVPDLCAAGITLEDAVQHLRGFFLVPDLTTSQWLDLIAEYTRLEPDLSLSQIAVAISTDLSFWASARAVLEAREDVSASTYSYEFAWKTPCYGGAWSPHGGELPFLFGVMDYPSAWDGGDTEELREAADPEGNRFRLSEAVIASWSAFARNGDPSTADATWPRWLAPAGATTVLDGDGFRVVEGRNLMRWEAIASLPRGI